MAFKRLDQSSASPLHAQRSSGRVSEITKIGAAEWSGKIPDKAAAHGGQRSAAAASGGVTPGNGIAAKPHTHNAAAQQPAAQHEGAKAAALEQLRSNTAVEDAASAPQPAASQQMADLLHAAATAVAAPAPATPFKLAAAAARQLPQQAYKPDEDLGDLAFPAVSSGHASRLLLRNRARQRWRQILYQLPLYLGISLAWLMLAGGRRGGRP